MNDSKSTNVSKDEKFEMSAYIAILYELRQAKRDLQDQIYENVFLVVSKRANHSDILITKFSLKTNSIIYLNVNEMQVFLRNNVRKVA